MKRRTVPALLAVLVISVLLLSGCGSGGKYADSKYVGTWKATAAEMSGMSLSVESIMGDFSVELEADGSAKAVIDDQKESGSWEPSDGGFKLKDSSDSLEFRDGAEKNTVTVDYSGVVITFEKQ